MAHNITKNQKQLYVKKNVLLLSTVYAFLLFISCEQVIEVELPNNEKSIVVEGKIEEGSCAEIFLTYNSAFFDDVNDNTIREMIITNAIIVLKSDVYEERLNLSFDQFIFPYIKYQGSNLIGEEGKSYVIEIELDNTLLTATTTIPPHVAIDSLKFKTVAPWDSLGYVWFHFTDPDTLGNYYRTFTKTIGKDSTFVHPFASLLDDKLVNGQSISYPIYRGRSYFIDTTEIDNNDELEQNKEPQWLFKVGDTVVIKLCTIDAQHYNFWKTFERQRATNGNPFASPTTAITNISQGKGVWGGYGAQTDTIIITLP